MNDIIYPAGLGENIEQDGYEPKLPDACYPDSNISGICDSDTIETSLANNIFVILWMSI